MVLEVVKPLIDRLQEVLESRLASLGGEVSTCSHEFLSLLDELERMASEKLERELRWRRVELPARRESEDLVLASYLVETMVVEIGIKGFNRCAPVAELARATGGPRVYARLLTPAGEVATLLAESARGRRGAEEAAHYIY